MSGVKVNTKALSSNSLSWWIFSRREVMAQWRRGLSGPMTAQLAINAGTYTHHGGHPGFDAFVMGGIGFLAGYTYPFFLPSSITGWSLVAVHATVAVAGGAIAKALGAPPGFAAGFSWGARLGAANAAWSALYGSWRTATRATFEASMATGGGANPLLTQGLWTTNLIGF